MKTKGRAPAPGRQEPLFLHQRILVEIQDKILSGQWPVGRRIPFEHELMKQYQCSRMTVSKVLTRLAQAGLIERRRKAGSFVRRPQSQSAVLDIPDVKTEVIARGLPYHHQILKRRKRRSSRAEGELFGKDGVVPVLEIECLHMAGKRPFCLEHRVINLLAVPEATNESFEEHSPGTWLLRQVPWTLAEHHIRAAAATPEMAAALQIKARSSCLIVERTTRSMDVTITFVRLAYPGDMHQLVASFTPIAAVPGAPPRRP